MKRRRILVVLGSVVTVAAAIVGARRADRVCERACAARYGDAREATVLAPPAVVAPPAPSVAPASTEKESPDEIDPWIGVAAAAEADELVVWSSTRIWSIAQDRFLLTGFEGVAGVAVAAEGTVYAIAGEGGWLGVARPGRPDEWRPAPLTGRTLGRQHVSGDDDPLMSDFVGLQTSGRWLAWIMSPAADKKPRLALTRDRGRSWTVQALPEETDLDFLGAAVRIRAGRLDLIVDYYTYADCGQNSAVHYGGRLGSNVWRPRPVVGGDDFHNYLGFTDDGRTLPITTVTGAGRTFTIRPSYEAGARYHLVRISRDEQRIVDDVPAGSMKLMAVDRHGRPLGIADGRPWRWSPERHWERLDVGIP